MAEFDIASYVSHIEANRSVKDTLMQNLSTRRPPYRISVTDLTNLKQAYFKRKHPEIAPPLDKLRARLWYLASHEGTYRLESQPNLNQMLVTRIDAIRQEPETIRDRVRAAVEVVVGQRVFPDLTIWP